MRDCGTRGLFISITDIQLEDIIQKHHTVVCASDSSPASPPASPPNPNSASTCYDDKSHFQPSCHKASVNSEMGVVETVILILRSAKAACQKSQSFYSRCAFLSERVCFGTFFLSLMSISKYKEILHGARLSFHLVPCRVSTASSLDWAAHLP